MELLLLRQAAVLLGAGLGAFTDAKTRLIPDWITLPMIGLGILVNIAEFRAELFYVGAVVFAIGYLAYWLGKIGGGDVKLFTGLALLMPYYAGSIFVLDVLFTAALTSVVFYGAFYASKYARKGIKWREIKSGVARATGFGVLLAVYFYTIYSYGLVRLESAAVLGIATAFALVFLALEKGIRKEFFLKKVRLSKLEEDEVIAQDFLDKKVKKILGLKFKGVLGKNELLALKKAGISSVPVYRELPPFAPFILLGVIAAIALPGLMEKMFFV